MANCEILDVRCEKKKKALSKFKTLTKLDIVFFLEFGIFKTWNLKKN